MLRAWGEVGVLLAVIGRAAAGEGTMTEEPHCSFIDLMAMVGAAVDANDPGMILDTAQWGACLAVKDLVGDVDIVPSCGGDGGGGDGGDGGDGGGGGDGGDGGSATPVDCDGEWSSCDSTCDSSTRTWTTITSPSTGGTPCPVDGYPALCSGAPYDHDDNANTPNNECDTHHGGPHWDGSSDASCVTQYTHTFTYGGGGCSGANEICSASNGEAPCTSATTLAECERLCLDDDTCSSYEFSASDGNVCHLSTSCHGETTADGDWQYYYRNYADCTFTAGLAGDDPDCDGTTCDDGDATTTDDVCRSGVCAGTVHDCDGEWSSCDSTCDSSTRTWTTITSPSTGGTPCPVDGYPALCSGAPYDHDDNANTPNNECDTHHGGPHWDGSSDASCVTQYTHTFTYGGGGCSGANEICSASNGEAPCTSATTLAECERLCLDDDTCSSYEFSASDGNVCHLSTSCHGETTADGDWQYYYRNYADCTFTAGLAGDDPDCDGTTCDDGDATTTDDVCRSGVCAGTVHDCDGEWSSCDSTCDSSTRTWTTITSPSTGGTPCPVDGYPALCSGAPYDHDDNANTPNNECDTHHGGPHWDGSSDASCVTQYTHTFTYGGGGCSGANEICSANESPCNTAGTEAECERLCLDDDTCSSYEFSTDNSQCYLSTSCHGATDPATGWVYYYRNYADCTFTAGLAGADPDCEGSPCDDGDATTTDDVCRSGVCAGTPGTP